MLFVTACYGQESQYRCSYQFDFLEDTLTSSYFRQEIYIVQIGDKLTKGFTYQKFHNDSLKKHNPDLYHKLFNASLERSMAEMRKTGDASYMNNNSFRPGGFPSDLYKDYRKNEIRVRDNILSQQIWYDDELKPQDWEIVDDTMTISGYPSQKAKCHWRGRDWEAWFAPEIPISEGPWKFYGLPGLITKLHDTQKHYSFELIGFQETKEAINTKMPKDAQKMDRKEFVRSAFSAQRAMMEKMSMAELGIDIELQTLRYDYIELDYK